MGPTEINSPFSFDFSITGTELKIYAQLAHAGM
jgi:hypothetical protein